MLQDWVRRIAAVADAPLRAHQLAQDLGRLRPEVAVELLADALDLAGRGAPAVAVFMGALEDLLARQLLGYELTCTLYRAASAAGLVSVQRLLLAPLPRQSQAVRGARKAAEGQDTLGMRTWKARTADRGQELERLLRDPDPRVVRNLLLNPRVTEKDVLALVTRRPVPAQVLREVASHDRWVRRRDVRRALVLNPFTPTEVALRLLPSLARQDLHAVAVDARVHAEVAQQAAVFAKARPPVSAPPAARGRSRAGEVAANEDLEQDLPPYRERR